MVRVFKARGFSRFMKKYESKIAGAVHEAMQDAFEAGVIDKRTMRDFDHRCLTKAKPLSAREIQKKTNPDKASTRGSHDPNGMVFPLLRTRSITTG